MPLLSLSSRAAFSLLLLLLLLFPTNDAAKDAGQQQHQQQQQQPAFFDAAALATSRHLDIALHPNDNGPPTTVSWPFTDMDDISGRADEFVASHEHLIAPSQLEEVRRGVEDYFFVQTGWQRVWSLLLNRNNDAAAAAAAAAAADDAPGDFVRGRVLYLPLLESGLGRRLMQLASAAQLAAALGRRLVVAWHRSQHCDAPFGDLFFLNGRSYYSSSSSSSPSSSPFLPPNVVVVDVNPDTTLVPASVAALRPSLRSYSSEEDLRGLRGRDGSNGTGIVSGVVDCWEGDDRDEEDEDEGGGNGTGAEGRAAEAEGEGGAEAGGGGAGKSRRRPCPRAVPILRVNTHRVPAAVLAEAKSIGAPLLALDPSSGMAFGLPGQSVQEWRARCHDLVLSQLRPAAALKPTVSRLEARLDAALSAALAKGKMMANQRGGGRGGAGAGADAGADREADRDADGAYDGVAGAGAAAARAAVAREGVVGLHVRRDQPGLDAADIELPVELDNPDGPWSDVGWSEVPLSAYADVAFEVAAAHAAHAANWGQKQPQPPPPLPPPLVFAVFSNEPRAAEALAKEIERRVLPAHPGAAAAVVVMSDHEGSLPPLPSLSTTSPPPPPRTTTTTTTTTTTSSSFPSYSPRDRSGLATAAAEWFVLARRCGLVVGAQRSEFPRTASAAGESLVGVELVPRLPPAHRRVAMGDLALIHDPRSASASSASSSSSTTSSAASFVSSSSSSRRRKRHHPGLCEDADLGWAALLKRAYGVGGVLCPSPPPPTAASLASSSSSSSSDSSSDSSASSFEDSPRRLMIGRPTIEAGAANGAGTSAWAGEWTIADVTLPPNGNNGHEERRSGGAGGGGAVVVIESLERLPMFADGAFDLVYASHCLEHVGWAAAVAALREWRRVLAPGGGALALAVPDVAALADVLAHESAAAAAAREGWGHGEGETGSGSDASAATAAAASAASADENVRTVLQVLYGAQRDASDFHRSGFTEAVLRDLLRGAGFCGVTRVGGFHRVPGDSTTLRIADVPISLNLHAVACAF